MLKLQHYSKIFPIYANGLRVGRKTLRNWQMVFNVKKCKVLHVGHNNLHHGYSMNGEVLQSVTEKTDLDVIVSNGNRKSGAFTSK